MKLAIAEGLALPLDVATQKIAWVGVSGSGKTYAATSLAERLLDAGVQVVALDPVGVWWGLRLAADGKSPGISVPVFGGLRGDVPLEPTGGKLIADLVVDRRTSAVIDVSQFEHDTDKARFAADFAKRFFFRMKSSPAPVHLFLEECQEFIPQNEQRGEEQMVHAFQRLVRIGRNFGVGCSLISQRPQDVNKKALNQAGTVFAFQVTGTHERKAVEAWISDKGLDVHLVDELPKLPIGEAFLWSPGWLRLSKRIAISPKRTFNASSTPEVGKRVVKARELAPIDLAQLRDEMAGTIERAKAEDPKLLRARVAELERELARKPAAAAAAPAKERVVEKRVEVPIMSMRDFARLEAAANRLEKAAAAPAALATEIRALMARLHIQTREPTPSAEAVAMGARSPARALVDPVARPTPVSTNGHSAIGTGGLRRILIALAQRPRGLSTRQIGVRARLSSKSGTFDTYLSKARQSGWVEGSRDQLRLTDAGAAALGEFTPLPEGRDLLDYWLNELGQSGAARMLRELAKAWPRKMAVAQLGEAVGLSPGSGTFDTYLSKLRSLELITGDRGSLSASPEFFGAGE